MKVPSSLGVSLSPAATGILAGPVPAAPLSPGVGTRDRWPSHQYPLSIEVSGHKGRPAGPNPKPLPQVPDPALPPSCHQVFQKRFNGSVSFFRGWNDYRFGFGRADSEYWLGSPTHPSIHPIHLYPSIHPHPHTPPASDSLSYHTGQKFSTFDRDQDLYVQNCAALSSGAWWFKSCHFSNLNGFYLGGAHLSYANGLNWAQWKGFYYSLRKSEMKIRRI
uniref:Microfibril associated protein 4 n=1 Tax=Chelonoidis abingdonii TaxID=106734 RepID=A0A8C0JAF0_CHEAB